MTKLTALPLACVIALSLAATPAFAAHGHRGHAHHAKHHGTSHHHASHHHTHKVGRKAAHRHRKLA